MPIEYVILAISGVHKNAEINQKLIVGITKLKKLKENRLEAQNNVGASQWNIFLWCQPDNIIIFLYVNNFEPNPILVNVNKLKPYKYVDQTLKGIQS
jgi:hypothetical protein